VIQSHVIEGARPVDLRPAVEAKDEIPERSGLRLGGENRTWRASVEKKSVVEVMEIVPQCRPRNVIRR